MVAPGIVAIPPMLVHINTVRRSQKFISVALCPHFPFPPVFHVPPLHILFLLSLRFLSMRSGSHINPARGSAGLCEALSSEIKEGAPVVNAFWCV